MFKKLLILPFVLLVTSVTALADDFLLSISSVEIEPGTTTVQVSVRLDNPMPVRSLAFAVQLPVGFTVQAVDKGDRVLGTMDQYQASSSLLMSFYSGAERGVFDGSTGEVCSLVLRVPEHQRGQVPITIYDWALTTVLGEHHGEPVAAITGYIVVPYDIASSGLFYSITGDTTLSVCHGPSSHCYSGDISIPDTVTSSGTTYQVTAIGQGAFASSPNLASVTIPSTVDSIGGSAFSQCAALSRVTCKAVTPPSTADAPFDQETCQNATLRVPASSVSAYCQADGWREFATILPITIRGDMNGDGLITISDVAQLIDQMITDTGTDNEIADVNGNGVVDIVDVVRLIDMILGLL